MDIEKVAKQAGPNAYVNIAIVDNKPMITGTTQKTYVLNNQSSGPVLRATDSSKTITLEELATLKSDHWSEKKLLEMRKSLSKEDQDVLRALESELKWQSGPIRKTIYNNVIIPVRENVGPDRTGSMTVSYLEELL